MLNSSELKKAKSKMKHRPMPAESTAKEVLSFVYEYGTEFKDQVIIGFYIADFVLLEKMLVIEIDGSSHKHKKEKDDFRDAFLRSCGFEVVRVPNSKAIYVLDAICEYPEVENFNKKFRSALAKANAKRSLVYTRDRKQLSL